MLDYSLSERAVLMRLSMGMPGEQRQDPAVTSEVKHDRNLGASSGKWVKNLYPVEALAAIKKLDNEARTYHASVTLPFDAGIGILPAKLIMEHGDRMRQFKGMREVLIEHFLEQPERWVEWAMREHNGTFEPGNYPGCEKVGEEFQISKKTFCEVMREKFKFETQPLPVPNAKHFTDTVASLLGTDTESVDLRIADAALEAQKELMRRLIAPVRAMASKLAEKPKQRKDGSQAEDIVFRDTLIGNLQDIAKLAPALNLSEDPTIAGFIKEVEALTRYSADTLRTSKSTRDEAQKAAQALVDKLSGYKL